MDARAFRRWYRWIEGQRIAYRMSLLAIAERLAKDNAKAKERAKSAPTDKAR
jgi:hypothetical protein